MKLAIDHHFSYDFAINHTPLRQSASRRRERFAAASVTVIDSCRFKTLSMTVESYQKILFFSFATLCFILCRQKEI